MQGLSGISGFFCIDKPAGWTSADVVAVVRGSLSKVAGYKVNVGHMGTLDPMATGVLVVAAGKAARLFDILMNKKKGYVASMAFGRETDTLDGEGKEVCSNSIYPSVAEVKGAMKNFIGEIEQIPPAFSAKSVGGVKAYKLARAGEEVKMRAARVHIYSLSILEVNGKSEYEENEPVYTMSYQVDCGGGTYIRSLCRDIAYSCNSLATMTSLIRTYSGNFTLNEACTIEEARTAPLDKLIPVTKALDGMFDRIELPKEQIKKFTNGISVFTDKCDGEVLVTIDGREYALAECRGGKIKAKINLWA